MGNTLNKVKDELEKVDKYVVLEVIIDEILLYESIRKEHHAKEYYDTLVQLLGQLKDLIREKK